LKTRSNRERLLASTIIGSALLAAVSATPAMAQDEPTEVGEIVVTGTRIARPNQTAPTAVQVIDQTLIESTGDINTGDILRSLPAVGVQGLSAVNSNFFTQNNGVATIDLRNLGADRTLVLVNGRRYVAGIPGSSNVDFNTIPTELVERIDVVTGGASAVYGSDALAGVINIITEDDYTGFEVFGQWGQTSYEDLERYRLGIKFGSDFADMRGNFVGTLSYSTSGPVYARTRDDRGMAYDGLGGAYFGLDNRTTLYACGIDPVATAAGLCSNTYSSFIPQGLALVPRTGLASLQRVVDGGVVQPYSAAYGFNRQSQRLLYVPQDAIHFTGQVNYQISENMNFFLESMGYFGSTNSDIEPSPVASADVYRDPTTNAPQGAVCTGVGAATVCRNGIPITSAVVPAALATAVRNANPGALDANLVVGWQRRMSEFGNRSNESNRTVLRLVAGIEGDVNENVSYEASVNWGRTTIGQLSGGQLLRDRIIQATDAITLPGGQVVCRNELERARGCQPFYVFQEGGGAAAVPYLSFNGQFDSYVEQFVANGYFSGSSGFGLPAGPIDWVIGGEYRLESSRNTPDPTLQLGLSTSNIAPETTGEYEVFEAFGELAVPLLAGLPLIQSLDLNLAARVSDYSTVGNTTAWAASLEYQPVSWLKARTQYAVAVRAPNIAELYSGRSQTFPSITDPCRGLTLSGGTPAFLNNPTNAASGVNASTVGNSAAMACYSDPALQARIARDGSFVLTQPELQGVGGFNEGNPNLASEESTSFTFGVLFNPAFHPWLEPLSISVDYYDIEIEDAIQGYGRGLTLTRCYGGSVAGARDPFYCQFINRYAAGTANVGAIYEVNQQSFNIGQLNTRGIDVQASYGLDLNDLGLAPETWDMGQVVFSLNYQHLLEYSTIAVAGAAPVESVGVVGLPENEAVLDILYTRGPLQWSVQTQFIGQSCYFSAGCDEDDYVSDQPIGLRYFVDTQVRYQLTDTTTAYLGVDNVFDEWVQIGQGHGQPTGWGTEPDVFDGLGRRYYVGFRQRF